MKKMFDFVFDREGNAVTGAEVYVRKQSDNTLVTLYSDNGVTTKANPTITDSDGEFSFYTADNTLKLQVYVGGVQQNEIDNLQHYDLSTVTTFGWSLIDDANAAAALTTLGVSAFAQTILDDADAATVRSTIGLGTIATQAASSVAITGGSVTGITDLAVADGGTGASTAAGARTNLGIDKQNLALPLTFNFAANGEARFYADEAMTLTQQATSGSGSVAYEKSTAAAPSTFSSTSSPITLEAGAWLKVTASSVLDIYAVHLKRTA